MKLRSLGRPRIFVRTDHPVPAAETARTMLVGSGARMVPTVYEALMVQRRRRMLVMALCIGLPTVLASVYYGLIASDRYVADTKMVLSEGKGPSIAASSGKSAVLAMVGLGGGEDAAGNAPEIVTNYLQSTEAMEALDRAIGLRRMWSVSSIDFLSRLSAGASTEDFYKYYQNHVSVVYDPLDPVIELKVTAFRAGDAQLIATTLVKLAQNKLNTAFLEIRKDALHFARSEVKDTQQQLTAVNDELRIFRNAHRDLDPNASAQAIGTVAGGLFAQLASAEADLRTALSYAREDSAPVKALKARIAALQKQIQVDRGLLAGSPSDKPIADVLATYEDLLLNQKFAQDAYTSAMAFLATSRSDLARQQTYLVDFLPPTLPQDATEPRSVRNILLVFLVSALLWLTASLVGSALREHAHL